MNNFANEGANYAKEKGQSALNDVTNTVKEASGKAKEVVKQSGEDWYDYLKEHPIQALLYGTVIFYAVKGLLSR